MDYQIPGLGASRAFVKWIFNNKVGSVSEPMTVGDQYVVALITGEKEKGVQSAAAARIMVEPILRNKEKAKQLVKKFGTYASIDDAAKNTAQQVQTVDSVRFSDNFKPAFGNEPIVIGASFNKAYQSKVSPPLSGNTGVYAIVVRNISTAAAENTSVEEQRKAAMMQMQQMMSFGWMQALKESAKIEDQRLKAGY